jgi:predicted GNAT superfamily acetyltransferase
MTVDIRVLHNADELSALPPFERFIWDEDDEMVSVNMLVATVSEGGVAIAAFDDEEVVGAVYGFPTHDPAVLHSHYLAVHPRLRGSGLGERLKREQAEWCVAAGYTSMRWTFDPLQLANAHLNLNKLGTIGVAYHINHYGALGGINGGMPSDRLTVQWYLTGVRPTFTETATVAVPPVTAEQIAAAAPAAFEARYAVRDSMAPLLHEGWRVTAVDRDGRTYTLSR